MTKQKIQLPYADLKFAGQEWARRHNTAVTEFQLPILRMITAWAQYAEDHKAEFDAPIGEDQLTGQEYWRTLGQSLRSLLACSGTGNLDCGTLDSYLLDTAKAHGVDLED
jgi:hypothetical protein